MSELKIMAVGDISLQTTENPFRKLESVFSSKDILIGNLETALSDCRDGTQKSVPISSKPWKAKFLKEAGFDILNLANNHVSDRGPLGLEDTLSALDREGLHSLGAGVFGRKSSVVINREGLAVGFLGYDQYGYDENGHYINRLNLDKITSDIFAIRLRCDLIVVSLHWGIENVYYPSPDQIKLAHSIIDAGVSVILGHHAHVLQGVEKYKRGLIAYSLGNFQFDHSISGPPSETGRRTDRSIILSFRIGEKGLISHEIIPVVINDNNEPELANQSTDIPNFIARISKPLSADTITRNWWFDKIAGQYINDSMRSWRLRIRRYGLMHLIRCCKWLVSPFVLRCFMSIIYNSFRRNYPDFEDNNANLSSGTSHMDRESEITVNVKL
jgi:poly-gamma-glutamate capsule biosynthesis protein CapA/YwtB (metallophosphatase superfamily)